MDNLWELRVRLLLSIQRALLGQVTPNIRAVTARIDSSIVTVRWIIDGEISARIKEDLAAVSAEVAADFASHQVIEEFIRCDGTHATDELHLDHVAYRRKE